MTHDLTDVEMIRYLRALSPPLPWWAWLRRRRYKAPAAPRSIVAQLRDRRAAGMKTTLHWIQTNRGPRLPADAEIDAHIGSWSSS
jgi:hypothetical protein